MKTIHTLLLLLFLSIGADAQRRDPMATLGSLPLDPSAKPLTHAVVTIQKIIENAWINPNYDGAAITSFMISVKPDNKDLIGPFYGTGDRLSAEIKNILQTRSGNNGKLFIDDIKVRCPDGRTRSLNTIVVQYTR